MKKLIALCAVSLLFSGCAATKANTAENCIMNPANAAKITQDFEGMTIGFCCKNCQGKFNALSDEAKKAKAGITN